MANFSIISCLAQVGILPVGATDRKAWYVLPSEGDAPVTVIFVNLNDGCWLNVREAHVGGSYKDLLQMLSPRVGIHCLGEVPHIECEWLYGCWPSSSKREDYVHILEVKEFTSTTINRVAALGLSTSFARKYTVDITFANGQRRGLRAIGVANIAGGYTAIHLGGKPRTLGPLGAALIPGDGNEPNTCLVTVGLEPFLRAETSVYDTIIIPSHSSINKIDPFVGLYDRALLLSPNKSRQALRSHLLQFDDVRLEDFYLPEDWEGTLWGNYNG